MTGIDLRGESVRAAEKAAVERGIDNAHFLEASVYELPFEDEEFDVVYANALFEWIDDFPRATSEISRVLKPGGLVAARSPDQVTRVLWPQSDLVDRFWSLFHRWRSHVGADDLAGRKLLSILRRGGFCIQRTSVSADPQGSPDRFEWYGRLVASWMRESDDISGVILEQGWADQTELDEMVAALVETTADPDAFVAIIWCEVLAQKPE